MKRRRVDDSVALELQEEAVRARCGELGVEDDLARAPGRLRMHVRVREVAFAKRDEVPTMADVGLERPHRSAVMADDEVKLRLLAGAKRSWVSRMP